MKLGCLEMEKWPWDSASPGVSAWLGYVFGIRDTVSTPWDPDDHFISKTSHL